MDQNTALLDAKARLADAKEMLKNHEENNNWMDSVDYHEERLDLQMDIWFATKHLDETERSMS